MLHLCCIYVAFSSGMHFVAFPNYLHFAFLLCFNYLGKTGHANRLDTSRLDKQQGRLDLISVGRRPHPQGLQTSTQGENGAIFLQNPDKMQASERPKTAQT